MDMHFMHESSSVEHTWSRLTLWFDIQYMFWCRRSCTGLTVDVNELSSELLLSKRRN